MRNILPALSVIFLCSCKQAKEEVFYTSPPAYDFSNPVIIHLKAELDEISGIAYYPKDSSLFAINDELGVLYKIMLRSRIKIQQWQFSFEGDYEDVVLKDSTFYVLESSGKIDAVRFLSNKTAQVRSFQPPLTGINNFETLYYDDEANRLIMLCKNCATDHKTKLSAYAFNPADSSFSEEAFYSISTDEINEMLGVETAKFKPSAAAVNPVTNDLYILSAVEKILVVASKEGTVKEAYYLDPRFFKQPEGISFVSNGDMFISNESAEIGSATILQYKFKPDLK